MLVTKRSQILKQTCRFVSVYVTFLLLPGIKGLRFEVSMVWKTKNIFEWCSMIAHVCQNLFNLLKKCLFYLSIDLIFVPFSILLFYCYFSPYIILSNSFYKKNLIKTKYFLLAFLLMLYSEVWTNSCFHD